MYIPVCADNGNMKKINFILIVLFAAVFFPSLVLAEDADVFRQEGIASWYGREFEGRPTASGEIFNPSLLTAAHPNLPFGTVIVVTNLHNNKSVTVRVNDRGPFVPARIVDVSRAAAEKLDMIITGTAPVKIESIDRIVLSGSQSNPIVGVQVSVTPPAPVVVTPAAPVRAGIPQAAEPPAPQSVTPVTQPFTAPLVVLQPAVIQPSFQFKLSPSVVIDPNKSYRLQVGSFRVARNAVDAFDRLKSAGLKPAYERHTDSNGEYFRVVLAGIRGSDVQITSEKIGAAGFREALIREEN